MKAGHVLAPIAHRNVADLDGISPFGFVVQGLRVNYLLPHNAFGAMGIRLTYGEDWSQRLCRSERLREALLTNLPAASALAALWQVEQWQAFGDGNVHWRPVLTACPECLASGYHSMLFQMPWVNRCPWHRVALVTNCSVCSTPLWKSISRDTPPLICQCGHDPVNSKLLLREPDEAINNRRRLVKRYLNWARSSRARRSVFGLQQDWAPLEGVSAMLLGGHQPWHQVLPPGDEVMARHSTIRHDRSRTLDIEDHDDLVRIAVATGRAKDLFMELPMSFEAPMKCVSASIASKLPPGSFSERERIWLGVSGVSELGDWRPRASVILLAAYRVHDKLFFDGRVLSRPVQAALQEICLAMAQRPDDQKYVEGCVRAFQRILLRGYASAAHYALAKLEDPGKPDDATAWRPVAMIRRRNTKSTLALLWLKEPLTAAGSEVDCSPEADSFCDGA